MYYLGKPLRYWVLHADPVTGEGWRGPEAVRALGTNAIPTLVRMLHEDDSRLQIGWHELLAKQHFIKDDWHPASYRKGYAAGALTSPLGTRNYFEGTLGVSLAKGLVEPDPRSDANSRAFALAALRQMKPWHKQAVEFLEGFLKCTDPVLRTNATNALIEFDPVAAAKAGCKR